MYTKSNIKVWWREQRERGHNFWQPECLQVQREKRSHKRFPDMGTKMKKQVIEDKIQCKENYKDQILDTKIVIKFTNNDFPFREKIKSLMVIVGNFHEGQIPKKREEKIMEG